MKTTLLISFITLLALSAAQAQKSGPAGTEAREFIEKAQRAKAEGRADEADELMRAAKKLQAEHRNAEAASVEPAKREALIREIEELHRAGKVEEAERLKHRLAGAGPGAHPVLLAAGRERLAHIAQAMEHARAAGLREEAEHLEQVLIRTKEDFGRKEHGGPGEPAPDERIHAALRDTHEGMENLRAQLTKMARAIEELRDQVQALKGAEGKK